MAVDAVTGSAPRPLPPPRSQGGSSVDRVVRRPGANAGGSTSASAGSAADAVAAGPTSTGNTRVTNRLAESPWRCNRRQAATVPAAAQLVRPRGPTPSSSQGTLHREQQPPRADQRGAATPARPVSPLRPSSPLRQRSQSTLPLATNAAATGAPHVSDTAAPLHGRRMLAQASSVPAFLQPAAVPHKSSSSTSDSSGNRGQINLAAVARAAAETAAGSQMKADAGASVLQHELLRCINEKQQTIRQMMEEVGRIRLACQNLEAESQRLHHRSHSAAAFGERGHSHPTTAKMAEVEAAEVALLLQKMSKDRARQEALLAAKASECEELLAMYRRNVCDVGGAGGVDGRHGAAESPSTTVASSSERYCDHHAANVTPQGDLGRSSRRKKPLVPRLPLSSAGLGCNGVTSPAQPHEVAPSANVGFGNGVTPAAPALQCSHDAESCGSSSSSSSRRSSPNNVVRATGMPISWEAKAMVPRSHRDEEEAPEERAVPKHLAEAFHEACSGDEDDAASCAGLGSSNCTGASPNKNRKALGTSQPRQQLSRQLARSTSRANLRESRELGQEFEGPAQSGTEALLPPSWGGRSGKNAVCLAGKAGCQFTVDSSDSDESASVASEHRRARERDVGLAGTVSKAASTADVSNTSINYRWPAPPVALSGRSEQSAQSPNLHQQQRSLAAAASPPAEHRFMNTMEGQQATSTVGLKGLRTSQSAAAIADFSTALLREARALREREAYMTAYPPAAPFLDSSSSTAQGPPMETSAAAVTPALKTSAGAGAGFLQSSPSAGQLVARPSPAAVCPSPLRPSRAVPAVVASSLTFGPNVRQTAPAPVLLRSWSTSGLCGSGTPGVGGCGGAPIQVLQASTSRTSSPVRQAASIPSSPAPTPGRSTPGMGGATIGSARHTRLTSPIRLRPSTSNPTLTLAAGIPSAMVTSSSGSTAVRLGGASPDFRPPPRVAPQVLGVPSGQPLGQLMMLVP
eukprot:TRINITY_DN33882_c0_g1_i1.p1 TRINITY_DN33882_c0_g1~~TRINITY_DN33882_c0_g1_i1.p1  ORF type:complete len:975 (+),score=160.85 TRINITY_DN33882_c0_g1_i1:67-2991(+)